ncbi:MAG TPA: hypothetical protein VF088_18525 [Pyrinomonadaceae bacterium]
MQMKLSVFILLSLLLVLTGLENSGLSVTDPQITKDHFIASLITSDAVLVPFAQYSHGHWENPWPKSSDASAKEPNTLANLPKPWFAEGRVPSPVWHFWSLDGKAHFLNASKIVEVQSHCQTLWGIASDLPKEEAVDDRYGMVGIALDIDRKVNPSYELNKTQDDGLKLQSFIQSEFGKEEQAKATELSRFLKPPRREEQKNKSVTLSHLYQMTIENTGERLYYFESLKEYKKPIPTNDQSCNDVFFNGWISAKSGELKVIDSKIGWTDCEGRLDSIPLGLLVFDSEVFIFTRDFGYEDEKYSIFKLSESRMQLMLETQGGGC